VKIGGEELWTCRSQSHTRGVCGPSNSLEGSRACPPIRSEECGSTAPSGFSSSSARGSEPRAPPLESLPDMKASHKSSVCAPSSACPKAGPGVTKSSMRSRASLRRCLPTPAEQNSPVPCSPFCMPKERVLWRRYPWHAVWPGSAALVHGDAFVAATCSPALQTRRQDQHPPAAGFSPCRGMMSSRRLF
jgi:hypothetical protein